MRLCYVANERRTYGARSENAGNTDGQKEYEACKYIPGLEPDPVEPDEESLRAFWRSPKL